MKPAWLTELHLEALTAVVDGDPVALVHRRPLREVLVQLTAQYTAEWALHATEIAMASPENPITQDDLESVQRLMGKGVQHNGLVPDLQTHEVGRALGIVGELCSRAHIGALDFDQQDELCSVFDDAAMHSTDWVRTRTLERQLRRGLGLPARQLDLPRNLGQVS